MTSSTHPFSEILNSKTYNTTIFSLSHTHTLLHSQHHQILNAFFKSCSHSQKLPIMHYGTFHNGLASLCSLHSKYLPILERSIHQSSV